MDARFTIVTSDNLADPTDRSLERMRRLAEMDLATATLPDNLFVSSRARRMPDLVVPTRFNVLVFSDSLRETLTRMARDTKVATALLDPAATTTDELNFVAFRPKDGVFSFLPNGRPHSLVPKKSDPSDTQWAREGRQTGRIGRVARSVLTATAIRGYGITETDFERFTALFQGVAQSNALEVMVVRGDDVVKYYSYRHSDGGNRSCMSGYTRLPLVDRYPEKVGLAIAWNPKRDVAMARTLFWTTDHGFVADRVYGNLAESLLMREHVLALGGFWKITGGAYEHRAGEEADKVGELTTCVRLGGPIPDLGHYLDTFGHWSSKSSGILYNNSGYLSDGFTPRR
jgi:hypothetical protein